MTATAEVPVVDKGGKMKLEKLRQTCLDREATFYDDVVSLKSLAMCEEEPGRLIIQRGENQPRESFEMLPHLYQQAPGVLYGLPGGYLKKLVEGDHADPELAARNFNFWVEANKDREILLRFAKGAEDPYLRAMLPASWNPIPYAQVIEALEAKHGKDQQVVVEKFDQTGLVFNFVTGKLDRKKAKKGDDVEWGMRFRDSDVGIGHLELLPYTMTLGCTNGCTTMGKGAAVRLSHSTKSAGDINEVLASVRQGMEMITGYSRTIITQMDKAEAILLEEEAMDEVFARINKRHDVTKLEDRYAREGWAIEAKERPEPTVLRLANAYTRAANAEELKAESRFKLQGVGGAILELTDTRYKWN